MAAELWYYRLDGRPHGPFSTVQFEKLIRGRAVLLSTDVSHDGMTWRSLRDMIESGVADEEPPCEPKADEMNAQTLVPGQLVLPTELRQKAKKPE
jgi:hypothetical protein